MLRPSQLPSIPITFVKSNEDILHHLIPNQQTVNFYGFTLTLYDLATMPSEDKANLLRILTISAPETCRWSVNSGYLQETFNKSSTIITITYVETFYLTQRQADFIAAFIMFDITGYIYLTCAKEFSSQKKYLKTGVDIIKLQLGLLLRCLAHTYMNQQEISKVFTEPSNQELMNYYTKLGYITSDRPFYFPDQRPLMFLDSIGVSNICQNALESLRKSFEEITANGYDDIYWVS